MGNIRLFIIVQNTYNLMNSILTTASKWLHTLRQNNHIVIRLDSLNSLRFQELSNSTVFYRLNQQQGEHQYGPLVHTMGRDLFTHAPAEAWVSTHLNPSPRTGRLGSEPLNQPDPHYTLLLLWDFTNNTGDTHWQFVNIYFTVCSQPREIWTEVNV